MSNAVQSLGNSIGQEIGKAIFGDPAANAANAAAAQQRNLAAQRSALAAEQLYKSGLYLLNLKPKTPASTAAAIVEFQKALDITPNDANILSKLASAKQQLKDIAVAGQTSDALSRVLPPAPPVNKGIVGDELTHGSIPSPNASALSLVNLDPSAVDLRSATSASPESLKNQLTGVFANNNAAAPPDPLLVLPQPGDFELLFDPPQASPSQWKGPQRPANSPKLVNPMDAEEQTKAQVEAVAAQPGGLNDLMEDQLIKDALAGLVPTKPVPAVPAAKPAPARPHN
jgi:hypothetical protein